MLLNPGVFVPMLWVLLVSANLTWLNQEQYSLSDGFIFYICTLSFFCIGICYAIIIVFKKVYVRHDFYTNRQFERYRILAPLLRRYFIFLYIFYIAVSVFYGQNLFNILFHIVLHSTLSQW